MAPVGGRAPFLLGTAAPARASRRSGARVAQPGGPPSPFRAAGAEAAAAPLVSFPFLFLGLCGLPPAGPRPLLRGQSGSGDSGWRVFRKFFLRAEGERPAPRVPPAPPPSGLGRGGGSTNSPRSPAAEPGGRRLARGGDPRGGEGQVEGKDCGAGSARPAAPAAASHRGPRPPAGGDGWTWGPGSCTSRRDAKALGGWPRRPRGGGPGRLRSAPPPLPAPACVAAAGTPFLHLGGPSPAPQDQTGAPIPPRRPLTGELLPGPGPGPR